MKDKFKIAKEMLGEKLKEAKTEKTGPESGESRENPARAKTGIYIKKPPRYMGVLGILAGLAFFFFLTGELRSIWECRNWPTVPGVIVSSKVVETDRLETNTLPDRKGMTSRFVYLPTITYNYTVEGTEYRSSQVFLWMDAEDFHQPDTAGEIVARYPVGKEVTVHYEPGNIGEAVLETSIKFTHVAFPLIGILFVLLGVWALLGKPHRG